MKLKGLRLRVNMLIGCIKPDRFLDDYRGNDLRDPSVFLEYGREAMQLVEVLKALYSGGGVMSNVNTGGGWGDGSTYEDIEAFKLENCHV